MEAGVEQVGLGRPRLRLIIISPACPWGQAHQDALGASLCPESKECASVMDEVEFHITPSSYLLPFLFPLPIGSILSSKDDGGIGGQKGITACLLKGEQLFGAGLIGGAQVIVEYAANAAHLIGAVFVDEVFVTPFFVLRVFFFSKRVHGIFQRTVEVFCVLFEQVIRGEVGASAKPSVCDITLLVVQFKIPPVGMRGGNIGVQGMDHERESGG